MEEVTCIPLLLIWIFFKFCWLYGIFHCVFNLLQLFYGYLPPVGIVFLAKFDHVDACWCDTPIQTTLTLHLSAELFDCVVKFRKIIEMHHVLMEILLHCDLI